MQLAEVLDTSVNPLSNLRFLEYSIPCENVLHNLEFFQQLGFTALPTNDIRNYPYAVVTDGRCFIGLHEKNYFESISQNPRISFVNENIAPIVSHLHDNDMSVLHSQLDEDEFQQTVFKSPHQTVVNVLAARSFSLPPKESYKDSVLGYFRGIVLPTSKLDKASEFWGNLGQLVMPTNNEKSMAVSSNRLNMLLVEDDNHDASGFIFEHPEPEQLFSHFSRYGITLEVSEQSLVLDSEYLLKAPNGMRLWVKREE